MLGLLASIPSPNSGAIHLGPLQLRAYGFMIALGVLAAGWLFGRRLEQRKLASRDAASSILLWSVAAGVIGSRIYHVVTDWGRYQHHLSDIPKLWEGGLGIPGGLALGIPVGMYVSKRKGLTARDAATAAAPAIPLAQAIGRWGNWWNQELFGRPTTLPWALRIDAAHLPAKYPVGTTFHPTFLYESLGNFIIVVALLVIERRWRPRPGRLMAIYLMGYSALRFGVESLRIDPANRIVGLRVNTWVSMLVFAGALAWLVLEQRRFAADPVSETVPEGEPAGADDSDDDGGPSDTETPG
jgi:prolipoprotein diacylglyceryl transferase